jgi:hypothetical protein
LTKYIQSMQISLSKYDWDVKLPDRYVKSVFIFPLHGDKYCNFGARHVPFYIYCIFIHFLYISIFTIYVTV